MRYVLIAIGYLPEYIKFTINTIKSVDKNAQIFICSDKKAEFKNTTFINLMDMSSQHIQELNEISIYKDTIFENNPLWKTSLERIFYLNEIKKNLKLTNFVHFDNDVLIYKPFEELTKFFDEQKLNITQSNFKKIIFGYSFVKSNQVLNDISDLIIDTCKFGEEHSWEFNGGKPFNEMQILGYINSKNPELFNTLPTLPTESMKLQSNTLFDPAGFGQYLDGTHVSPKKWGRKGYSSQNDFIGTEFISGRIKSNFKNVPIVKWEKKKYYLANLHVHSKRLKKFLPNNYKEY